MPNDNWKTLRVPPDAYEAAQEQRKAAGRTWGEQIVRDSEEWVIGDKIEAEPLVDTKAVLDRLDDLEARLPRKVAEELGR